jgi:hypothetical protein
MDAIHAPIEPGAGLVTEGFGTSGGIGRSLGRMIIGAMGTGTAAAFHFVSQALRSPRPI